MVCVSFGRPRETQREFGVIELYHDETGAGPDGRVSTPMNQKSLRKPVGCSGIALHSGIDVEMKLLPAETGSGLTLRRTDIANGGSLIPVSWENVVSSHLATTIGNEHVANTPLAKVTRDSRGEFMNTALERVSRDLPSANAIRWMYDIDPPPLYARSGGFTDPDDRVDRWQMIRFEPPSHVWLDVGLARAGTGAPEGDRSQGVTHTVIDAITPETETSTHYFWTFPRNHQLNDVELNEYFQKGVASTFLEDKEMIEGQQEIIEANPCAPQIEINADAASIIARNIIAELLEKEQSNNIT